MPMSLHATNVNASGGSSSLGNETKPVYIDSTGRFALGNEYYSISDVYNKTEIDDMFDGFKDAIESNINQKVEYIVLKVAPASGAIIWAMELANGVLPNDEMRAKILANVEAYQKTQAGTK